MPKRRTGWMIFGISLSGLTLLAVLLVLKQPGWTEREIPTFRAYASNHRGYAAQFMPCSQATPAITRSERCQIIYHDLMAWLWQQAAEIKGEDQIVLGKKYRF